jgi:hypothetical protein
MFTTFSRRTRPERTLEWMIEAYKKVPNLVIVPVMTSYDRITDSFKNKPDYLGDVYVRYLEPYHMNKLVGGSVTLT